MLDIVSRLRALNELSERLKRLEKNHDIAAGFSVSVWQGPRIHRGQELDPAISDLPILDPKLMPELLGLLLRAVDDATKINRSLLASEFREAAEFLNIPIDRDAIS